MEKLWSAANVKVYGGGVDDDRFLRRISDLIGTHTYISRIESTGHGRGDSRGSTSTSQSVQERTILSVAELRELPQGRAVLFASGTPAGLIEPQPWYTGPHAETIYASLQAHSPTHSPAPILGQPGPTVTASPPASPWDVVAITRSEEE